jgi:hypothetical protein
VFGVPWAFAGKGRGIFKNTAYLYRHTSMFLAGIQGRSWIPAKNMPE